MFKWNIWSTEADYIVSVDVLALLFFRSTNHDVRWACEWLLTANAGNWWTECTDPRDCITRYRGHQWFAKNVFNSVVEVGSWTDVSLRLTFATEVGVRMYFRVTAVRMRNICCFLFIGFLYDGNVCHVDCTAAIAGVRRILYFGDTRLSRTTYLFDREVGAIT